ncbi:unnamed protein product [Symbiodinium pilosum]|uniref:Uncharacterized protein n=1 Tax=Symbiodinium pilosum TaxID=2952 RepID=A0A812QYU2_SYMPI|nr:unnamed protein product [Symbiodinium pilosum]
MMSGPNSRQCWKCLMETTRKTYGGGRKACWKGLQELEKCLLTCFETTAVHEHLEFRERGQAFTKTSCLCCPSVEVF